MEFSELENLLRNVIELRDHHVRSLSPYFDTKTKGFRRVRYDDSGGDDPAEDRSFSLSSSSTCIASLIATGQWDDWNSDTEVILKAHISVVWEGAGLEENNIYSTAFAMEAIELLKQLHPQPRLTRREQDKIEAGDKKLLKGFSEDGFAALPTYPPSAYMTQLVARVLLRRRDASKVIMAEWPRISPGIQKRAWEEINRQVVFKTANSKSFDPYELAYSILLVLMLADPNRATPDETSILQTALDQLFDAQLSDGSWPRGGPLFHHPNLGSAFCFEYEMLVQLLGESKLQDRLLKYLPKLRDAIIALRESARGTPEGGRAWSSGHHRHETRPESWSTASVYHFLQLVDRLIAEQIRQSLYEYLDKPYIARVGISDQFAPNMLDCDLTPLSQATASLKETLTTHFVTLIKNNSELVAQGRSLPESTPMSAILFGPPGTSKTQLAKEISKFLGWPLLIIDPSHFTRHGLDRIQAEADRVFGMLATADRIVVLLDEFDEMVRERVMADNILSRFLTTAMLPKLADINERRRIVFLVATNHIENFDLAISRPGRFDMIVQVMPPTFREKDKRWGITSHLSRLGINRNHLLNATQSLSIDELVELLTYAECQALVKELQNLPDGDTAEATARIESIKKNCTLLASMFPSDSDSIMPPPTWKDACKRQRKYIRLPRLTGQVIQLKLPL